MTLIKFMLEKDSKDEVWACIMNHAREGLTQYGTPTTYYECYSHIGQHSECDIRYLHECKQATTNEYLPLLNELIGQGYKDLEILNSQKITCHRLPSISEIKFGEGATHYRDFTMGEIGITKQGNIKKWFVAKDDGLRYYTN